MIDVTGPKVLIPSLMFAFMNILSYPEDLNELVYRSLAFTILYWFIAKFLVRVTITTADLVTPTVLSILLMPGAFVTIPPGTFASGMTNSTAKGVHIMIYAIVLSVIRTLFSGYY